MTDAGPDDVGTLGEEAAKLLGALSGWARDHAAEAGDGLSGLASQASASAHELNEHLATGAAELRRIALTQSQLGDGQTVDLAVVSDKTFVPANVAALKSGDTRQLGVRVFRAYVEPKQ